MSEESDDEVPGGESLEVMNYRRKYQMLLERCEVLQQDNERLINRIQHVHKFVRQVEKERLFLMDRLTNKHNDNWRVAVKKYWIDSLNRDLPKKTEPAKRSYRRSSASKKSSKKEKEPKASRRTPKEAKQMKSEFETSENLF